MPKRRNIRNLAVEEDRAHKRKLLATVNSGGLWPLTAPGMPAPGPDFARAAMLLGDVPAEDSQVFSPGPNLIKLYTKALRSPGFTLDVEVKQGTYSTVSFVPGHIWGQNVEEWQKSLVEVGYKAPGVTGPQPAEVFVLGKMPWTEEVAEGRNLVGESGRILTALIQKLRVKGATSWYVTNLCKFMPPNEIRKLKTGWIRDCLPLLQQELRIVKPKFILCLGAEATKWLLGSEFNVANMSGRIVPYSIDMRVDDNDETEPHIAQVSTILHPAAVAKDPAQYRILESGFSRFASLLTTKVVEAEEKGIDHRACYTYEDAVDWFDEVTTELESVPKKDRLVGWDLEWQGSHPVNKGSYISTIQCSWAHKKAICFAIHHSGGKVAFRDRDGKPAIRRLVKLLNRFAKKTRAVGHFMVSDLEWAESIGLDLRAGSEIPLYGEGDKQAWQLLRDGQGWLDTAMMSHSIEETSPLGLEVLAMRYTTAPRYDLRLEEWKKEYLKKNKLKKEDLPGYGDCPDNIRIPYANYDADVTRRIAVALLPLIEADYDGHCVWESLWESMIIQAPILRIHQNGICVSRDRIDDLTKKFLHWRDVKENEIKTWAKWPTFNVRSVQQVKEFLFGEQLNGKKTEDNQVVRIRPAEGRSLFITPLLDTSKPPKRWADIVEKNLENEHSPSTGKMVLSILAQDNLHVADQINMIRDYRYLDQVLKSVLRAPKQDENDMWIEDEDGFLEYEAGLANCIDDDGRVRTHLYPTAETARWKSRRPNLQNISKSRDGDYVRLLGGKKNEKGKWSGGDYTCSLRSIMHASPGYALIEADYKGAELYIMALMSGSKKMQDHCTRALLPDEGFDEKGNKVDGGKFPHPSYYDIHSNVACLTFQLTCHPSKKGLDSIGKEHFRTLAKNVIFGIAYGRQAKAIALQAKEQGIKVTVDDAQKVINAIFEMYPELNPYFTGAKRRAVEERWICTSFGRFRRFAETNDYKLEGEFERQGMNFSIQSTVASCVNRGIAFLNAKIEELKLLDDIRVLLQIHDAILIEARYQYVEFAKQLIQWALCEMVEIWPTDLAGNPRGDGPYHLGLDFEVSKNWGEKFTPEEAAQVGS